MKKFIIYAVILLVPLFFEARLYFVYAGSTVESGKEAEKLNAEKLNKESRERFETSRKLLCEKMTKRTEEYRNSLDGLLFTVNSYGRKALEAKDAKAYMEFVLIAIDYNSVLGDLGLMQVILDLSKFVEEQKFMEYYVLMENGFERLKDSFSLKNELFLNRIAQFKNEDALRYERELLRRYKDYFEYDLRLDKIDKAEDVLKQGNKNLEKKR